MKFLVFPRSGLHLYCWSHYKIKDYDYKRFLLSKKSNYLVHMIRIYKCFLNHIWRKWIQLMYPALKNFVILMNSYWFDALVEMAITRKNEWKMPMMIAINIARGKLLRACARIPGVNAQGWGWGYQLCACAGRC